MDSEQPQVVYVLMPEQNQSNSFSKTSWLSILSIIVGGAQAIGSVLLYTHKLGFLVGLALFIIGILRQMLSGTNGTNSLSGFSQRYNNLVQFNYSRQQVN